MLVVGIQAIEKMRSFGNMTTGLQLVMERLQSVVPSARFLLVDLNLNKPIVSGPKGKHWPKNEIETVLYFVPTDKLFTRRSNSKIAAGVIGEDTKTLTNE